LIERFLLLINSHRGRKVSTVMPVRVVFFECEDWQMVAVNKLFF